LGPPWRNLVASPRREQLRYLISDDPPRALITHELLIVTAQAP